MIYPAKNCSSLQYYFIYCTSNSSSYKMVIHAFYFPLFCFILYIKLKTTVDPSYQSYSSMLKPTLSISCIDCSDIFCWICYLNLYLFKLVHLFCHILAAVFEYFYILTIPIIRTLTRMSVILNELDCISK